MILKPYQHFVWDFDGMLFDSYDHTTQALMKTLSDFGITAERKEVYDALRISVGTARDKYRMDEAMYRRLYEYENDINMEPVIKPYPGIPEILRRIVREGGKNYLLTNRDQKAGEYLEKYDIKDCFTEVVDTTYGFPRKPNPQGMLYLKERYGFSNNVMMLGDRELDIEAGLGGGADGCFFDEFRKNPPTKAKYKVYTIIELEQLLFGE